MGSGVGFAIASLELLGYLGHHVDCRSYDQESNAGESQMRFLWVSIGLAVLLMIPFIIWDELFTEYLSSGNLRPWLEDHLGYGWLVGIALLVGDLFLPIPGTVVMSVLGNVYGPLLGGIVSALGS